MVKTIDRAKISLIHIAKTQLNLNEETYRSILSGIGVLSSKELTVDGFKKLMEAFKKLGFKSSSSRNQRSYKKQYENKKYMSNQIWGCTKAEKEYIESLWYEKARSKTQWSLEAFIYRMTKKSSAFLNKQDVVMIIEALKNLK
ncbi:MAG: regulatory protein GemA [Spirochaetes bacterium]|nr:regulatory protein GemA [Spirochaetota bacterium]